MAGAVSLYFNDACRPDAHATMKTLAATLHPALDARRPSGFLKRSRCLPCVFCGRAVEMRRDDCPAGPDAFAICQEDDARLDAALARVTRDVMALLDGPRGAVAKFGRPSPAITAWRL